MGADLISWIALLSGRYSVTTRQIQSLLQEQWDLRFSVGAISQAQRPVSEWLQPLYAQIGDAVRQAKVAHADETTHYRGGERRCLWTLCTESAVDFLTHYSRGKGAARERLQHFDGMVVTTITRRTGVNCVGRILSAILKASRDDEAMLWTFLAYPGLPLTNNAAERALRPYVIWRKVSFFSQSYRGDQFRPLILSISETCKRLGVNYYSILRRACALGQRGEIVTVRLPIPDQRQLLLA